MSGIRKGLEDWAGSFNFSGAYKTFARVSNLFSTRSDSLKGVEAQIELPSQFLRKMGGELYLDQMNHNSSTYLHWFDELETGSFFNGKNYKKLEEILYGTMSNESKKTQILSLLDSKTGDWGHTSFKPHLLVALGADFSKTNCNSDSERRVYAKEFMRDADVFLSHEGVSVVRESGVSDLDKPQVARVFYSAADFKKLDRDLPYPERGL